MMSERPVVEGAQRASRRGAARPHAVVVGSGIAGLIAALHAVEAGCRVTLVTKDVLEHANTRYAQGGIAGVLFDDDRLVDHLHDTMTAGAGLNDPRAVRVLVSEGAARIRELVALGVAFDRDERGAFVKGLEAAHSYPRILHAGGDATGTAIEHALVERLRTSGVEVLEHAFLVDLVVEGAASAHQLRRIAPSSQDSAEMLRSSHDSAEFADAVRVTGVELLVDGERRMLAADAVVVATGGAGQLYAHTTNPTVATGDGIAAALRAGALVADLEFVQFHPTVLVGTADAAGLAGTADAAGLAGTADAAGLVGTADAAGLASGDAFLVSEAVRGEGAVLVDDDGRRFAFDDHPDGELAPRDVLARAITRRMAEQNGRPVRLDATRLRATAAETASFLAHRFPTIDAAVRDRGLDWAREPIPVTPAAHYLMGGVVTDLWGRTSVPGLYAVGEVARTGVHGANRLASNSLLEGAVFGARAGDVLVADAAGAGEPWPTVDTWPRRLAPRNPAAPPPRPSDPAEPLGTDTPFSRAALQQLMWEHAGLLRDGAGLGHAASVLASWRAATRTPATVAEFEDENLLAVAAALVEAASARTSSVGAHFRIDDPRGGPAPAGAIHIDEAQRTPAATTAFAPNGS